MDLGLLRRRTLLFVLAYVLLLAAWPLVRPLYVPAFRAGAELAVGIIDPFGGEVRVLFDPALPDDPVAKDMPGMDTRVRLQHLRYSGGEALAGASSFFHGYHPTIVLVALFLATPMSWRSRRWRFLWAVLLLTAFIALRCVVGAYSAFAASTIGGEPAVALTPFQQRALYWARHVLWEEPVATYVVPLLCWGLCAFAGRSVATDAARPARKERSFPAATSS
jgi:hypothetical protein